MRKIQVKKLTLSKETLGDLEKNELRKAVAKSVAGNLKLTLERFESGETVEGLADHEHRPRVPDDFEALGHGAAHVGEGRPFHGLSLVGCITRWSILESVAL